MFWSIGLRFSSYHILLKLLNTTWLIMERGKITFILWVIPQKMMQEYKKWVSIMFYSLFNWFKLEPKSNLIVFFKVHIWMINLILYSLSNNSLKVGLNLQKNFHFTLKNKFLMLKLLNINKTSVNYQMSSLIFIHSSQTQKFINT